MTESDYSLPMLLFGEVRGASTGDTGLDGPYSPSCRVAKTLWVAETCPSMPFLSVFPGNDINTGVIENENRYRKCRQKRWLQSSLQPLTTNKIENLTEAKDCGKDTDVTWQSENKEIPQRENQPKNLQSPLQPLNTRKIENLTPAKNCGKDTNATRQTEVKPGSKQIPQRRNNLQNNSQNRERHLLAQTRQAKKTSRDAQQHSVTRLSRVKHPVREPIRWRKLAAVHREAKRAAQLKCVRHAKQPVRKQIRYHQRMQSRRRIIKSPNSLRPASAGDQNSSAMVCRVSRSLSLSLSLSLYSTLCYL